MPLEPPRDFRASSHEPLQQTMARLRQTLRIQPDSQVGLKPAEDPASSGPPLEIGATGGKGAVDATYSRLISENKVFLATRVDPASLLAERHSLARLHRSLVECETILRYFAAGPNRTGFVGRMLNAFQRFVHRALNWFVGPSIGFDKSATEALAETTAAIDIVQRQIYLIAHELAVLSERLTSLEATKDTTRNEP